MKDNIEIKKQLINNRSIQYQRNITTMQVIIDIVEDVTKLEVITDSRANGSPLARKLVALFGRKYISNISMSTIGGVMDRDHASVSVMLRSGNDLLDVDKEFQQWYKKINKRLKYKCQKELIEKELMFYQKKVSKYKRLKKVS